MNVAAQLKELIASTLKEFNLPSADLVELTEQCNRFLEGKGRLPPRKIIDRFLMIGALSIVAAQMEIESCHSTVLGYPTPALVQWCIARGWSMEQVRRLFFVYEVPVDVARMARILTMAKAGELEAAEVTPRDAILIESAIE